MPASAAAWARRTPAISGAVLERRRRMNSRSSGTISIPSERRRSATPTGSAAGTVRLVAPSFRAARALSSASISSQRMPRPTSSSSPSS